MSSNDVDVSPPERDRTANQRWMIGLVVTLVFGCFGVVMALLSYMDRDRTTVHPTRESPAAAPTTPGRDPAPVKEHKSRGRDKK